MALFLWLQDDEPVSVTIAYEEEQSSEATQGDDVDFFDSLDFLEESSASSDADPDGAIDMDGLAEELAPDDLPDQTPGWDIAVMRGLDKVTARVWMFEAPIDQPVMFGRLEVNVRRCNKQPPEETPNTTAFVQVDEQKLSNEKERVFSGWMFASSPGLSAVEHPVYDVWLIDCKMADPSAVVGIEENVEASAESDMVPATSSLTTAD